MSNPNPSPSRRPVGNVCYAYAYVQSEILNEFTNADNDSVALFAAVYILLYFLAAEGATGRLIRGSQ